MQRLVRALAALVLLPALGGCFQSTKELIPAAEGEFPFTRLTYAATGEEDKVLIATASNNASLGVNAATPYEYRAYVDPAFDYEAEKIGLELAYLPAGEEQPAWGAPNADYLFLYRRYDEIVGDGVQYWWFPYPEHFRNSAARKRMMNKVGMPGYWRKHGFPPQCRAVGDDDFECE